MSRFLPPPKIRFESAPATRRPGPYPSIVEGDNELERLGGIYEPTKRLHNYLPHYWMHFRDIRHKVTNVLEIGVQTDRSLRMWEEFFPNATIYGLDIDPACKEFEGGRRRMYIGDQGDPAVLRQLAREVDGALDIVIDDGSHLVRHQLTSFEVLFPLMSEHGIYVVEDTSGAVGDEGFATVRAFQRLVRNVMYWPAGLNASNWPRLWTFDDRATWADRNIVGVAFYRWLIFVTKGRNPEDNPYLGPRE